MVENSAISNTDPVLNTNNPQASDVSSNGASNADDFQSTAQPQDLQTNQPVSVLQTGEPISGEVVKEDSWGFTGMLPFILAALVIFVAIAYIVKRLLASDTFILQAAEPVSTPKKSAPAKKSAVKAATPAPKLKKTVKKPAKKQPPHRRKKSKR